MDNKLSKPVFVKLSTLQNGFDGYNVYVKVVSVEAGNNEEGKTPIVKAVVADQTAAANAFFRGDTVKLIKVGAVLAIRNGRINYVKDHISLEIDAFGRVTSETLDIKTKTDFNISEAEAKRRPRRRNDEKPRGDGPRGGQRGGNRNQGERPRREDNQQRRPPREHREHNDRPPREHREHNDRPPREHREHNDRPPREHREHNDRPPREHREHNDRPPREHREHNDRPPREYQKRQDHGERPPRRDYEERRGGEQRKQPTKFTKIGAIQPGDDNLNLIAKVISAKEVGKRVRVVLGDETGIVNGFLYVNDSIKEGGSIVIFKCEAKVVKEHIEIQLMERGKVDEARRKVESVNEKVNVSAKEWIESA